MGIDRDAGATGHGTGFALEPAERISLLKASFVKSDGVMRLSNKYHTAPIKIAKAFTLQEQLAVIVMDVSPGLLGGDRYELDWGAEAGAHVMITNQSYTKVHPCMPGGGSSMSQRFRLEEGAVVEHMPEPVMLYRSASFRCDTNVELAPGSVWMQGDVLCPGRTLRGERFQYRAYDNRLHVYAGDELIFSQRQYVAPELHRLQASGSWEEMTHSATFYLFADTVSGVHLECLQETIERFDQSSAHPVVAGASMTHRHGIAVTAASTAAWPLQALISSLWAAARNSLLGKPPLRLLQA